MQPLKTYYAQEIEIWPKTHPNRVVIHYEITGIVGKAYLKSATAAVAANVFRKTASFTYNRPCLIILIPEESQRTITS
jgi:hypothetical protein